MSAAKTERLMNLVILLLVARRPVTKEHIRETIEDYRETASDEAFEKKFERDKDEIRELGIPISVEPVDAYFDDELGYRIKRADFELPPIDFDAEEVAVLGLAARVWENAGLAASTSEAVAKLRAAGEAPDTAVLGELRPGMLENDPAFDAVFAATQSRTQITFEYRRPGASATTERHLQPWGVVTSRGRWYVVGHDIDREAPRMFRLSRIVGDVGTIGRPGSFTVPEGTDVAGLTRALTPQPGEQAVLRVREDAALGLRREATSVEPLGGGWDRIVLPPRPIDSIASSVLTFGDTVVVEAPAELRDLVIKRLTELAGVR